MDLVTTFLIAIGLAMDAFAVSLGAGTSPGRRSWRKVFRLAFHFGLFQGGMTFIGWLAGSTISRFISTFDHWIALGLLAFVGVRMIISGIKPDDDGEECSTSDPSRGGTLVLLSVATSIDALAVGLSYALIDGNIWFPVVMIGVVTLILSALGVLLGEKLGCRFGKRMEIIGGLILVGIGIRVVVSHLF